MATDAVEIWPDNLEAFHLFSKLGTQWRIGMGGPTGLDFNVVYHKMDRMNLTPDQYDDLEHCIQIMERAALNCMRTE